MARKWADDIARSNPDKMTPEEIRQDLAVYLERKEFVKALYEKAKTNPDMKLPGGVTLEQLELAVEGDPKTGERVPLTFSVENGKLSHNVDEAKRLFAEFQADLRQVFASEGISDAVVVQLGSGTTGWSSAPGAYKEAGTGVTRPKLGKEWAPSSDTDFAIFSDQALMQAMKEGAMVNPTNKQAGVYTTIKNTGKAGRKGLVDTPLGKKLKKLTQDWNARIYGEEFRFRDDKFDFKLNLQSDKPFKSAVPVLQVSHPQVVPLTTSLKPGATHALEIAGRAGPYFGVTVGDPRLILPPNTRGRREFHVTLITPPELAGLSAANRAKVSSGVDIAGQPTAGAVVRKDIGETPSYQLAVSWKEGQEFRASLGLPEKDLHVSLAGGIGDAVVVRDAANTVTPDDQQ